MPAAFRAAFSDVKLVKGRKVAQLIFEIPIEEFDAAYEVLGGMPVAASERWFGIAAIQVPQAEKEITQNVAHIDAPATSQSVVDKPPAGAKRDWRDLQPAQQAGIRCAEPIFVAFLQENHQKEWHETGEAAACVRFILNIHSRAEINTNHKVRAAWHQLDEQFQGWKAMEHA